MGAVKALRLFPVAVIAASVALGLLAGSVLGDRLSSAAEAASTSKLAWLISAEDRFRNYDFNSQTDSSTNVDWAISMLFHNNAEVDKVKDIFRGQYPYNGGPKYARLNDGSGYVWDGDSGIKDVSCPGIGREARHMRVYADSDNSMYNVFYGYYVLGSTHKDWQECCLPCIKQFGWSELIEGVFTQYARDAGYDAFDDWGNFYNYEAPRWEGNHYWDNNGSASRVVVP